MTASKILIGLLISFSTTAFAQTQTAQPLGSQLIEQTIWLDFDFDRTKDQWKGVDLATGNVVHNPQIGTDGWDIRFYQGWIGTNHGFAGIIEDMKFSDVKTVPDTSEFLFTADDYSKPSGWKLSSDFFNETLSLWKYYHLVEWSSEKRHSLEPLENIFILKNPTKKQNPAPSTFHYAKFEVLEYVANLKGYPWDVKHETRVWTIGKPELEKAIGDGKAFDAGKVYIKIHAKLNPIVDAKTLE